MSLENHFRAKFTDLSTAELRNIVENPTDYQKQAVLAAKALLGERGGVIQKEAEVETPSEIKKEETAQDNITLGITERIIPFIIDRVLILALASALSLLFPLEQRTVTYYVNDIIVYQGYPFAWVFVLFAYYVLFEYLLEATPGKFLIRALVVRDNGQKMSFVTVCMRTLFRLMGVGDLFIFSDKRKPLRDFYLKTTVIKKEKREELIELHKMTEGDHLVSNEL